MTSSISSPADLDSRLTDIVPIAAQQAGETDRSGVQADMIGRLRGAGLLEALDPAFRLEATRALARACAATAWIAAELSEGNALAKAVSGAAPGGLTTIARYSDDVQIASASNGFVVNGTWQAVGALSHADGVLLIAPATEDRDALVALAPRDSLEVETYHYLGGLRGVSWHRVTARNLAIASANVGPARPVMLGGIGANRLLGVLVGCAEGGYDDYVRMTKARITGIGGAAVATFTQVQARLAESHADMGTVRYLYDGILRDLAASDDDAAIASRITRDRAFLARKALDAVTRLVRQMGAMGLSETNPVQRRYRDLRAISADESFSWDAQLAQFGRRELGIEDMPTRTAA